MTARDRFVLMVLGTMFLINVLVFEMIHLMEVYL